MSDMTFSELSAWLAGLPAVPVLIVVGVILGWAALIGICGRMPDPRR